MKLDVKLCSSKSYCLFSIQQYCLSSGECVDEGRMKELCPRNKTEMPCEKGKVRTTGQNLNPDINPNPNAYINGNLNPESNHKPILCSIHNSVIQNLIVRFSY
jgi:hypothetical protein